MSDHAAEAYRHRLSVRNRFVTDEKLDEDDLQQIVKRQYLPKGVILRNRTTKGTIRNAPVDSTSLICGLLAGICQAGVFNPYDRALYLSVKHQRKFLSKLNWQNPYNGFLQSLGGRALSGGFYFPVEHLFLRMMDTEFSHGQTNFVAGTAAGAVNAIVLNPLTAIKYKTWGRDVNHGMWTEAFGMIRKAGGSARPFFNGLMPTLYRDVVFGGCYTWLRLQIQWWFDLEPHEQWKANFCAAGLATIASGPFNYARNIQYGTKSRDRASSTLQVLQELLEEVAHSKEAGTPLAKLKMLSNRLRIGWGTARVAMGMAFAHAVYDGLQKKLREPHYEEEAMYHATTTTAVGR